MTPRGAFLKANNVICLAWLSNELGNRFHFTNCTNMRTDTDAHQPTHCNYLLLFTSQHLPQRKHVSPCAVLCGTFNKFALAKCFYFLTDLRASHRREIVRITNTRSMSGQLTVGPTIHCPTACHLAFHMSDLTSFWQLPSTGTFCQIWHLPPLNITHARCLLKSSSVWFRGRG